MLLHVHPRSSTRKPLSHVTNETCQHKALQGLSLAVKPFNPHVHSLCGLTVPHSGTMWLGGCLMVVGLVGRQLHAGPSSSTRMIQC